MNRVSTGIRVRVRTFGAADHVHSGSDAIYRVYCNEW